ncbi:MAG: hypothetical protein B7Z55_14955 [Planctomycetales bacterium 12-60-4]|nr:MAG: hypothetical protein B7Z55_14955 [Planctomycetales bacterium 12-60-4]
MHPAIIRACTLLVFSGSALGCGQTAPYTGETRFPVQGKVTFNGEPVNGGTIAFIQQDEKSRPAGGPIVNGTYRVTENQGPNASTYRVEIRWLKPTGAKRKDDDTGEMVDVVKEVIPKRFNDQSELSASVSHEKLDFNFDLKP